MAAKKKTKKKVRKKKRIQREYDLEAGVLRMNGLELHFKMGLTSQVYMKLAMMGAGALLAKVPDNKKLALWEKIRQNKFGVQRNYERTPDVVKALAMIDNTTLDKAISAYRGMDKEERKLLREDKRIQEQLLLMKLKKLQESS